MRSSKAIIIASEVILHLISAVVSFYALREFFEPIVPHRSLLLFFTFVVIFVIEIAVWRLMDDSLRDKSPSKSVHVINWVLTGIFILLSAGLTTIGAGSFAVDNQDPVVLMKDDPTLNDVRNQIKADQARIDKLQEFASQRVKWRRNNPAEEAEIAIITQRIANNNEWIREQVSRKQATNDTIMSENKANLELLSIVYSDFGFATQVMLVLLAFGRFKHDQSDGTLSQSKGKTRQNPSQNQGKTRKRINVSDEVAEKIIEVYKDNPSLSRQQIGQMVGKDKSTVSRVLNSEKWSYELNGDYDDN